MRTQAPHVIALAGPTASGKSSWALRLAKKIGGAIIAADSRTVFTELNIGAGKVTTEYPAKRVKRSGQTTYVIEGVDHYGLDLVSLDTPFTVVDFQQYVATLLPALVAKNQIPVLVGGTGLYIQAVVEGYQFPQAAALPSEWGVRSTQALLDELTAWDPETARTIDRTNRRRVERALGYVLCYGQSFRASQRKRPPGFLSAVYLIDLDRPALYRRIDERLEQRFGQGLLGEVESLVSQGHASELLQLGLEYGIIADWLLHPERRESLVDLKARLAGRIHAYARRQLSWWRRVRDVRWVRSYTELEQDARHFLKRP